MGNYTRTYSLTDGTTAYGSQVAFELDALGSSVNNIVNAQISSGAAISDSKLAQITTAGKVSGAALTSLASIPVGAGVIPAANLVGIAISGQVIQVVNTQLQTPASGTTVIPFDNTIPQNTEGDQYLSRAITPGNASNLLKITVILQVTCSAATAHGALALFQDATASALATACIYSPEAATPTSYSMVYYMTAGTTSATTFKIRAGYNTGTCNVNQGTSTLFNGTLCSSITIEEIKA